MIRVRDYKPDSPEWVMASFFDCWKRRAWAQMLKYVQPSWLAKYEQPNKILRQSLHTLVDTEFIQMNANTGIVAVFLVGIRRKLYTITDHSIQAVRLVREGKKWGIDPSYLIARVIP